MFAAHPQMSCLPETSFVRRMISCGRLQSIYKKGGKNAVSQTLSRDDYFFRTGLDVSAVVARASGQNGLLDAAVYREMLASYAGKDYAWSGDKDPRAVEFLSLLKAGLPNVNVIHVFRDPRDVLGYKKKAAWSKKCALIVANRAVYILRDGKIRLLGPVNGSRPLALCVANHTFYYGEYRSNQERSPVHIWKLCETDRQWQATWQFSGIRHVHGVFHDPYKNDLWVTTGDIGHEAGIWRSDDGFKTLHKIVGGSQQVRAVQLLFSQEHVYFGSDTPNEKNHIYRMDREGKRIEQLASVNSSVFYGCKVKDCLFFSTVVEPSSVNTTRYAEIWGSADGVSWRVICRFKKDFWPIKFFQYGQILFPSGPGDDENLWFTPMGVKFDPKILKIPLHECEFKVQACS